ncbi:hypothetical protein lacNasYZ03_09770 [Lactobacillus nasalidis]|uniref:HXXEE domain-containing protein n=1 Tax=Lactobacillus nasalidis TaxID=2797258 RepID=A0ABQ3W7G5_9LACO|nr:HXXEE domain-containing protein [Lactobacillus nasalidis]GHV96883.1 hypothetical protein lacNasYZ01_00650 [Lactobacillus nasalidis]GHW00175.1 hypothetical protein lacNasYZ02_16040 [Lactobacillus nasalidis]GHW01290.1 hypothetical protein lacNasYZ03_09770 [Lactobacillus nasalidis]
MKWYLKNWAWVAVYLAAGIFLLAALGNWDFQTKLVLLALALLQLHFFEEMDRPGGFPYMGLWAETGEKSQNPRDWSLNNASAAFGNEYFAVVVYGLALLFPKQAWLLLAVFIFSFVELAMHGIFFTVKIKNWYNPGLVTACLLSLVSVVFFLNTGLHFNIWDHVLAFAWIAFNYWLAFRSPLYQKLGQLKEYSFPAESMDRSRVIMKKVLRDK